MIQSITFQDQVSVSFNQLNQRRSLKEFRTECIKAHCVSLCNQLFCIVGEFCFDGRGGGGRGRGGG